MIRKFQTTLSTPFMTFWKEACMTLEKKAAHELRDAFQFLAIWRDHFESAHGELHALSSLSNPNDPPDVIAHFGAGDVPIEITSIEPPHVHQSQDLHDKVGNGGGRSEVPISVKPANRQQALDWMYLPGGGPWENVSDRNETWARSIRDRILAKLGGSSIGSIGPGVILLTGSLDGSVGEDDAIQKAFSSIRRQHPESKDWTLAVCHQWNDSQFYSALDSPHSGFAIRRA